MKKVKFLDKIKSSKLGSKLSEVAPEILDIAGSLIPGGGALKVISESIRNKREIKEEDRAELEKLLLEFESNELVEYMKDRDSARKMQVAALQQEDKFSKRFVYYFTIHWSVFSSMYIFYITAFKIEPENIRIVDTVLGFMLGTAIASMFGFFYGGSYKQPVERVKSFVSQIKSSLT